MADAAREEDGIGPAIDIVGIRRGFVAGVVGMEDWDVSRLRETREMVLYDFGSRQGAQAACVALKQAQDMRLQDVDDSFNPGCTVILGQGEGPPPGVRLPVKYRILAEHGFSHDPLRTFDRCVEILQARAWDEFPACRSAPSEAKVAATEAEAPPVEANVAARGTKRLGCSPRLNRVGRGPYREHMFEVPVTGYWRRLQDPKAYGPGKDKELVLGERWIETYKRGEGKETRPYDHPLEIRRRAREEAKAAAKAAKAAAGETPCTP